jgi:uncharacterized membrane protein
MRRLLGFAFVALLLSGCVATASIDSGAPTAAPQAEASGAPSASGCERTPGACATERVLITVVDYLTFFAELCSALVIAVGAVRALLHFLPHILRPAPPEETYKETIRLQLGKSPALALEFELGADILKTAVAPSFGIIAQLAAIIVLRTLLNYFLERELRQTEQRRAGQHLAPTAAPADVARRREDQA